MKERIIVLSAKGWSLEDERTKQVREGVSVHYVMTDNLTPNVDSISGVEGYIPMKQSISIDEAKKLQGVPGVYDGSFQMRASGGKILFIY